MFCFQAHLLDVFIKVAISCKIKPAVFIIEESQPLLKYITHEEFKKSLLPAMQKAMLRNPEIILECVGHVMLRLSLDLSQYAKEIGKSLTGEILILYYFSLLSLFILADCKSKSKFS